MRISDLSSDVCSSDLGDEFLEVQPGAEGPRPGGGEDDAADGAVGGEGVEQVGNLAIERQRQGIGGRTIDLDRRDLARSEERRVGAGGVRKGWVWWSPVHYIKKKIDITRRNNHK